MRQQRFEMAAIDRDWIKRIGWRSVDDVLACGSDAVAAVSRTSDVVQVPLDSDFGGPDHVFVKRYRYEEIGQRIKQMFRGTLFGKSRARREFEFLIEMRRRHVPTVRPIAYGEKRRLAFLHASFVITEGSAGFQSLDLFSLNHLRRAPLTRSERHTLIDGLAETIRTMHEAGIRHGGLFWRNILIRTRPDGGYDFALLDPDTHGRMYASPVPQAHVLADLSEVVASGMALGQRGGIVSLLKAYWQVPRLTAEHRSMAARIIERARPLARSEHQRMAITEAIEWFRGRMARAQQDQKHLCGFRSLDEFFDSLSAGTTAPKPAKGAGKIIRFSFRGASDGNGANDRTVIMDGEHITISPTATTQQDLLIRTDPETWLAVMAGRPEAYAAMRSGQLRMQGDTTLLPALMDLIDRADSCDREPASDGVPLSDQGLDTDRGPEADRVLVSAGSVGGSSRSDGLEGSAQALSSQGAAPREFGRKYKADDYAKYYASKHDAKLGRRISNHFERRMIRRALQRIRSHHRVDSVLDCPSGTGRFLPTLASLGVSVIAMDTSDAMLREGRVHHGLFDVLPVVCAGTALRLALPDDAVDVVLCSRLLHHIPDRQDRLKILQEFARVARVGVVLSFFDSASLRAWKRKRKTKRTGKPSGRHAMSRAMCVTEAAEANLKPIGMNALLRFHTEVTAAAFLC